MKVVSASIVILAASILITGGSHISDNDTRLFVQVVGCILGLAGLIVWVPGIKEMR